MGALERCPLKTIDFMAQMRPALSCWLLGLLAAVSILIAPQARALDVDFDVAMIILDDYIEQAGLSTRLVGNDNDANGLKEEDQLGMLSAILAGGSVVSCINSSRITAITSAYNANFPKVKTELTVTVSGYGTVDIVNQLNSSNPQLGTALQNTITGFLTIADTSTITFVNNLADQLATAILTSLNQSGQVNSVKNQINFLASDYDTYGNAPPGPNYLGPAGDIENDGLTNLSEYTVGAVPKGRELWLTDCCITAPLRIVTVTGGGLKLSGLPESFSVSVAGGNSNKTFQWRKGTASNFTVMSNSPNYNISFLTANAGGTYYCVVSDGATTRTTPNLVLSVTFVSLYFTQQPQGATRSAGSSYTFNAAVAGGAGPGPYTYTWRRGNTTVGTNSPSLTLSNLQASNAGTYTVRVSSNGGGDTITSQNAVLNVNTGAFNITQQPVSARRYVGQDLTLTVAVSGGSGNFQYVWTRNGSTISTSTSPSLSGTNLGLANAGTYRCVITDLNTSSQLTSDAAVVEMAEPLQIIQQPQSSSVSVGESFAFTIATTGGFAPVAYQWKWESLSIPGETSSTYETVAYSGFGGGYTCVATDANGTALTSETAVLEVSASVEILQDPQGGDYYVGDSAVLSVVATSGSIYTYDWRKDGVSLGRPSTSILSIGSLSLDDEGDYSVVVSKAGLGSATSASANLRVRTTPSITSPPQATTVYIGSDATFSVAATGGYPPLAFQWRRNSVNIDLATSANLLLQNVTAANQGSYSCAVLDQKGTQQISNGASLVVVARMAINSQPVGDEIYAGETFSLAVSVSGGVPPLTYLWKRDGEVIDAPNAAQLSFDPVEATDAGTYTCEISDAGDETVISDPAVVDVALPFSVLTQPQAATLFVGERLDLTFLVEGGFTPLQYAWRRNGVPIAGATSSTYTILNVVEGHEGEYACTVRDRFNRIVTSQTVDVTVAEPLVVSIEPELARKYVDQPITITALVESGEGDYHYAWRKDGLPFGAPDQPSLATEFVQLSDAASYTCLVTDSSGRGAQTPACVVDVQNLPAITSDLQDDTAAIGSTATLSLGVSGGFAPIQYSWERDGSLVGTLDVGNLVIAPVSLESAGTYECVVTDALGTVLNSGPALLSVLPALAITVQPEGQGVVIGQAVEFSIVATGGVPTVTYNWYLGDDLVSQGASLSIESVEEGDLGFYVCIVEDADGNTISSDVFELSLVEDLTIVEQPASTKRYLGESATFSVEVIGGEGDLNYTWKRNGETVGENTPVVSIPAVEILDSGSYTCTVTDGQATATTDAAVLAVASPLSVNATNELQYRFVTTSTEAVVVPSGGFGPYTYEWLRDGQAFSTDGPTLQLSSLGLGDSGEYACTVRDGYGSADAGTVLRLRVMPEPLQHNADRDNNGLIALTELLRVIQFYNAGALHCQSGTEDGFAPLTGEIDSCFPHSSDYTPANWNISLSELLRLIQFYNAGGFHPCFGDGEDGFCPGPPVVSEGEGAPAEGEGLSEGEGVVEGEGA